MQIISVFIFCMHQWSLYFTLENKKRTSFSCYFTIFTFNLGYTEAESSLLFILEGGIFWLIVRVIFTGFNINFPFFISWKPYVVLVQLACNRWSTKFLDMDLIKEIELGGCHRWKLFFVVPWWFMTYLHLLPFVNN